MNTEVQFLRFAIKRCTLLDILIVLFSIECSLGIVVLGNPFCVVPLVLFWALQSLYFQKRWEQEKGLTKDLCESIEKLASFKKPKASGVKHV